MNPVIHLIHKMMTIIILIHKWTSLVKGRTENNMKVNRQKERKKDEQEADSSSKTINGCLMFSQFDKINKQIHCQLFFFATWESQALTKHLF